MSIDNLYGCDMRDWKLFEGFEEWVCTLDGSPCGSTNPRSPDKCPDFYISHDFCPQEFPGRVVNVYVGNGAVIPKRLLAETNDGADKDIVWCPSCDCTWPFQAFLREHIITREEQLKDLEFARGE